MVSLLDKTLIRQTGEDEPRVGMLQTIREYASERLAQVGDAATLRRQHAAYYRRWAREAEKKLYGPQRTAWLDRLESEHDNLRAALRWAQETEEAELGLGLAIALSHFWPGRGYAGEGRRWLTELLALGGSVPPTLRAAALKAAAWLAYAQRDYRSAHELLEQSLALACEMGDHRAMADALTRLGRVEGWQGDYGRAQESLERGVELARSAGDKALISYALRTLRWVSVRHGNAPAALPLAEEGLTLARELGDPQALRDALRVMVQVPPGSCGRRAATGQLRPRGEAAGGGAAARAAQLDEATGP